MPKLIVKSYDEYREAMFLGNIRGKRDYLTGDMLIVKKDLLLQLMQVREVLSDENQKVGFQEAIDLIEHLDN